MEATEFRSRVVAFEPASSPPSPAFVIRTIEITTSRVMIFASIDQLCNTINCDYVFVVLRKRKSANTL